jgi:hypothetical protein
MSAILRKVHNLSGGLVRKDVVDVRLLKERGHLVIPLLIFDKYYIVETDFSLEDSFGKLKQSG